MRLENEALRLHGKEANIVVEPIGSADVLERVTGFHSQQYILPMESTTQSSHDIRTRVLFREGSEPRLVPLRGD